jgi:hypothetical protein
LGFKDLALLNPERDLSINEFKDVIFKDWNYDIRLVMKSMGLFCLFLVGRRHGEGESS